MKKMMALFLAGIMTISAGCSVNVAMDDNGKTAVDEVPVEDVTSKEDPAKGGIPWIDSDLKDNITEDMELSPKDDFHLYVNYDWLLRSNIQAGKTQNDAFEEVKEKTYEKVRDLLNGDRVSGHDAELVYSLYDALTDWDARNEAGLDPIMDTIEDIRSIDKIDDLSDFICDPVRSQFVPTFMGCANSISFDDSDRYIVAVLNDVFLLQDAAEYENRTDIGDNAYKGSLYLIKDVMTRMDYTEDEVKDIFDDVIAFEGRMAEKSFTKADMMSPDYVEKINNIYSPSELEDLTSSFPLYRYIKANKYGDAERYLVVQPEFIKRVDELYTEDNLETIKNYMIIKYIYDIASYLDREAYDAYVESGNIMNGSEGSEDYETVAIDIVRSELTTSIDRLYLEKYDASEKKKMITDMCHEIIDVYREMLADEDWLSDETKEKAIQKLDTMKILAVYPDKWIDYSGLDLKGKSLLECKRAISFFNKEQDVSHTNGTPDREIWDTDILESNAYYDFSDNSINIVLGILDEPFYYDGMSEEALLGTIGACIGHEISHAFDVRGAQYDKDGNYINWWTDEDYKAFKERADRLIRYYDGITAWRDQQVIGKNIQGEAIADMAGMKAILKMVEGKDDFDYKEFFEAYATIWRRNITREGEYSSVMYDKHPLRFLRTNVTLQQFDEFYDTYDVKEGDNMYLAPKDRVLVW